MGSCTLRKAGCSQFQLLQILHVQELQWANSRCEPLSLILVDDDDDDDDDFSKDCTSTQAHWHPQVLL